MTRAVLIDNQGFFVEDIPGDPAYDVESPAPNTAPAWPVSVYLRPRWNGAAWIEGDDNAQTVLAAAEIRAAKAWRDRELRDTADEVPGDRPASALLTAWIAYRQALRDWPQAPGFPSIQSRPVRPQ